MAEETETKKEGEAPKKGSKKLIIIIAVVVLILGGAGAFFALSGGPKEGEGESEEVIEEEIQEHHHSESVELGTFLVNLSENATFLKATVVLEVNSDLLHEGHSAGGEEGGGGHGGGESASKLPGVLGMKEANIKDRVIKILSTKRAQQLLDAEGKVELSEEIADAVNQIVELDEELVSNVFFTTFIIQ
jgi:flagellar FliL protein